MEGDSFWRRADINNAQQMMRNAKLKYLAGDEAALETFWKWQSYIIYWRGEIPGGRVVRFAKSERKTARAPARPRWTPPVTSWKPEPLSWL